MQAGPLCGAPCPTSGSRQLGFERGLAGEVARLHPRDPVNLTLASAYPGLEHADVLSGLHAHKKVGSRSALRLIHSCSFIHSWAKDAPLSCTHRVDATFVAKRRLERVVKRFSCAVRLLLDMALGNLQVSKFAWMCKG
jgi:hypothetical protein